MLQAFNLHLKKLEKNYPEKMQASLPSFSVISFIASNFNSPVRITLLFVFIYTSNCISFILFVFRFLERRQNLPDLVGRPS